MEAEAVNHFNCIYKLTSPSGKVYIGQTKDFNRRIVEHQTTDDCIAIHNAIEKYGIKQFTIEILEENIPSNKLNEREMYYINQYDSYNTGYNLTRGGDGILRPDGKGVRYGTGKYGITKDNPNYDKIKGREYRKTHIEEEKKRRREYYLSHKEERREHQKEYGKQYRETHKEELKESRKLNYINHREERREYNKEYHKTHPRDRREYRREYEQRDYVKEKKRVRSKEYYQRPDIKEKHKEYCKKYYEKQKAIKKAQENKGQMELTTFLY